MAEEIPIQEPNMAALFGTLGNQITNLNSSIKAQGVLNIVPEYDGNSKNFKDWIKAIEKYGVLADLTDISKRHIALLTSRGSVSDFVQRYISENAAGTWEAFKRELTSRFADITDQQHAFLLLSRTRQEKDENVQLFAERLLTIASEAYVGLGAEGTAAIQQQMIGFFVDGLAYDYLKMKIMRDNPPDLQAAVRIALAEQNLRKRFDLRMNKPESQKNQRHDDRGQGQRGQRDTHYGGQRDTHDGGYKQSNDHEPMDVDHARPRRRYPYPARGESQKGASNYRPQVNAFLCWECGVEGHPRRKCDKFICPKCHRQGHFGNECRWQGRPYKQGN
jgi:predicted RNA-binding Zn-ribbon protein involved in translation (DUF1610 family)